MSDYQSTTVEILQTYQTDKAKEAIKPSTTVEILQTYQTWLILDDFENLQQQKSYRRIRHIDEPREVKIYNSRNLIDVLDI